MGAIMNAVVGGGLCTEAEAKQVSATLVSHIDACTDRSQLSISESGLRRGMLAQAAVAQVGNAEELHQSLLRTIRQRMLRVTLQAEPAWSRTPARGFTRYVERCSSKGRTVWKEGASQLSSTIAEKPAVAGEQQPSLK